MIFVNGYLILWNKLIRNLNKLKEDCEYSLSTTDSETENFLIKKQNMLNISGRSGHIVNLTGGYMGGWTCLSKELFEEDFPILHWEEMAASASGRSSSSLWLL